MTTSQPSIADAPPAALPPASSRLLIFVLAALVVVRLYIMLHFQLFQDEALYSWMSFKAPASFSPHPPGTPFLTRAGVTLFGKTEIGARIAFFALAFLTLVPVWLLARRVLAPSLAGWGVITVACAPAYLAFGAIATPDGPQLFFYVWALYFTWRALETNRTAWWLAAGAVVGCGLYIKYILILYFPALGLCLLLPTPLRRAWRTPGPYVAALTAFLFFVPLAAWCMSQDGFSAIKYHIQGRQESSGFVPVEAAIYQAAHLAYYSPLLYIGALAGMVWAGKSAFKRGDARLAFLFGFSVFTWAFFSIICAFTERILNREQWDAMIYVPAFLCAIAWFNDLVARRRAVGGDVLGALRLGVTALVVGPLMVGAILLEGHTGCFSRFTGDPPTRKLIGWREMSAAVDDAVASLPNDAPKFVIAGSFAPAVQYYFYGKQTDRVYAYLGKQDAKYGLTQMMKNEQMTQKDILDLEIGSHGTYVNLEDPLKTGGFDDGPDKRKGKLVLLFDNLEEKPKVVIDFFGKPVKRYRIYTGLKLHVPAEEPKQGS